MNLSIDDLIDKCQKIILAKGLDVYKREVDDYLKSIEGDKIEKLIEQGNRLSASFSVDENVEKSVVYYSRALEEMKKNKKVDKEILLNISLVVYPVYSKVVNEIAMNKD